VLVLATGSVFPPGHPATRLSLELLVETLAAAPCPQLLDVGCGSGVLLLAGVAAAPRRPGVDLAWRAVATTRNNARVNGLADAVQVVQGSTECLRHAFGVMLGNLPWAVQMDKVAEFTRLAAPDARLILSGFKDTQEDELRAGYEQAGWVLETRRTRDDGSFDSRRKSYLGGWRLRRR
jgi:ribosomal protein L11 methylase PrmA